MLSKCVYLLMLVGLMKREVSTQNVVVEDDPMYDLTDVPPIKAKKVSLLLKTFFELEDVSMFSEKDMTFRLDYYLELEWEADEGYCLRYVNQTTNIRKRVAIPSPDFGQFLWFPDVFLVEAKNEGIPSKVTSNQVVEIEYHRTGCTLRLIAKMSSIVGCQMDLHKYPVDIQVCNVTFRSYQSDSEVVTLVWNDPALQVRPAIVLPDQELSYQIGSTTINFLGDNYTAVYAQLTFKRLVMSNLIITFVPSFVIVLVSWLTFWMSLVAIPGRVSVSVTALLALLQQFTSIRYSLPNMYYINATDIWMIGCMIFVFATLLQFSLIKYIHTSTAKDEEPLLYLSKPIKPSLTPTHEEPRLAGLLPLLAQRRLEKSRTIPSNRVSPTQPTLSIKYYNNDAQIDRWSEQSDETISRSSSVRSDYSSKTLYRASPPMPANLPVYGNIASHPPKVANWGPRISNLGPNRAALRDIADTEVKRVNQKAQLNATEVIKVKTPVKSQPKEKPSICMRIDYYSRIAFPFAFGFFNLFYWTSVIYDFF